MHNFLILDGVGSANQRRSRFIQRNIRLTQLAGGGLASNIGTSFSDGLLLQPDASPQPASGELTAGASSGNLRWPGGSRRKKDFRAVNAPVFGQADVLRYMRKHRLAVVSSCAADGAPQGALVGVATTDSMELVFDTISSSRKHENLSRDHRIAVTFSGPDEQTLQLEGIVLPVSTRGSDDAVYREAYYLAWPDGRDRLKWNNLSYWRILPRWARYSDYGLGPLIAEFRWGAS